MFEKIIRKQVENEKEYIKMCENAMRGSLNEFMVLFWGDEIRKHEYAIDKLNGVLNLVSLT